MKESKRAYMEYLKSDHWKALRSVIFDRDKGMCVRCKGRNGLQAHHTFYRARFKDSQPEDLITLCCNCHHYAHGKWSKKSTKLRQQLSMQAKRFPSQAPSDKKLGRWWEAR